jgi:hypothetical protein
MEQHSKWSPTKQKTAQNWRHDSDVFNESAERWENAPEAPKTSDDECQGCGRWLSPVIKVMDDVPYCTDCIKNGKSSSKRPVRGRIDKRAHYPVPNVSLHDIQAPAVGATCAFCGQGSNQFHGAVQSFPDPSNPVEHKVVAHQPHFEEYQASLGTGQTVAPSTTKTVGGGGGGGVTINIFANRDEDS